MIDASIDQDFAALERQESFRGREGTPRQAEESSRTVVYHGKLAARASHSGQTGTLISPPTPSTSTSSPPPDPLGHLRAARLGFAAAVILVCYWLWIRRKA